MKIPVGVIGTCERNISACENARVRRRVCTGWSHVMVGPAWCMESSQLRLGHRLHWNQSWLSTRKLVDARYQVEEKGWEFQRVYLQKNLTTAQSGMLIKNLFHALFLQLLLLAIKRKCTTYCLHPQRPGNQTKNSQLRMLPDRTDNRLWIDSYPIFWFATSTKEVTRNSQMQLDIDKWIFTWWILTNAIGW